MSKRPEITSAAYSIGKEKNLHSLLVKMKTSLDSM